MIQLDRQCPKGSQAGEDQGCSLMTAFCKPSAAVEGGGSGWLWTTGSGAGKAAIR